MTSDPDKFSELETRIMRTIELVKTTRQRKKAEKELPRRDQIGHLERELEQLRRERDLVKNKVNPCWKPCRNSPRKPLSKANRERSTSKSTIRNIRSS